MHLNAPFLFLDTTVETPRLIFCAAWYNVAPNGTTWHHVAPNGTTCYHVAQNFFLIFFN